MNQTENSDLDNTLDSIARRVVAAKLETPAVFFLELHKPLKGVAHTLGLFLEPMAAPFFGIERVEKYRVIFEKEENIEKLISLIESFSIGNKPLGVSK